MIDALKTGFSYRCCEGRAREFRDSGHDQHRYWIAHAIGRANTPDARRTLTELKEFSVGPFAQTGIEEAIGNFRQSL
jgi:hypothetical protein